MRNNKNYCEISTNKMWIYFLRHPVHTTYTRLYDDLYTVVSDFTKTCKSFWNRGITTISTQHFSLITSEQTSKKMPPNGELLKFNITNKIYGPTRPRPNRWSLD